MRDIRKALNCGALTAAALFGATAAASAACTVAGTWHVFLIQGTTPNIQTVMTDVRNGAGNGQTTIRVFPNAGMPFENSTAEAVKCKLRLGANGRFANDSCTAYGTQPGDGGNGPVSGRIIFGTGPNSCQINGGSIVTGDPEPVTLLGGYVNGTSGAGIGRTGAGSVLLFNMVKAE